MPILHFALLAGLLASTLPFVFKAQGEAQDRQLGLQFAGAVAAAILTAAAIAIGGLSVGRWPFLLVAAGTGLGNAINLLAYFSLVVHRGPVSISWSVLWMGSVVLAVVGWLALGEPIYLLQPLALVSFLGCLVVMGLAAYRTNLRRGAVQPIRKGYWLFLAVAFVSGATGAFLLKVVKLPWMAPYAGHDLSFLLVGNAVMVAMLLLCRLGGAPMSRDARTVRLAVLFAVVQMGILLAVLAGLARGQMSSFFPAQAGTAIFFGVVWAVVRGERPSRLVFVGAALAILSIVLINVKGPVLLAR